jgi:hypothetical protein
VKVGRDTFIQPSLTRPLAAGVDATRGFEMLWWFERAGRHTRVEVLQLATDDYELRVIDADGVEQIEHFTNAVDLAKRQETIQQTLVECGWTGPQGWML